MKKFIIAMVIAFFATPSTADAQIVIGQKESIPVKIATVVMHWDWLYYNPGTKIYYLVMKSTNQFEKDLWLNLGNKEEAALTLQQFSEIAATIKKDDSYPIKNGNEEIVITKYMKGLSFIAAGKAGYYPIVKMHLDKAKSLVLEHKE